MPSRDLRCFALVCRAGKLQHEANSLGLQALAEVAPAQAAAAMTAYIETFQSGNQIPYPIHGATLDSRLCTWLDVAMCLFCCHADSAQ